MAVRSPFACCLLALSLHVVANHLAADPRFELVPDALDPQACGGSGCWTNHLRAADLDGDGDLDLILVNYPDFFDGNDMPEPLVIYENDGSGALTNVSATAVFVLLTLR